ncbi:hypothetical protein OB985_29645 [Bacillus cereus]|nr:hypothetical protein [Bacillus cereus]
MESKMTVLLNAMKETTERQKAHERARAIARRRNKNLPPNIEYVRSMYQSEGMDEKIVVFDISELRGTEKQMVDMLNRKLCGRPFTNQVSNLKELRACYKVGFRPYGKIMSYEKAVKLLLEKGSVCMTINI